MKKMKFIFKSGEEEFINTVIDAKVDGEVITFSHEGADYLIRTERFGFRRDSEDGRFIIRALENGAEAEFILRETEGSFPIGVKDFEFTKDDKQLFIKYKLASDEEQCKEIILTFDD